MQTAGRWLQMREQHGKPNCRYFTSWKSGEVIVAVPVRLIAFVLAKSWTPCLLDVLQMWCTKTAWSCFQILCLSMLQMLLKYFAWFEFWCPSITMRYRSFTVNRFGFRTLTWRCVFPKVVGRPRLHFGAPLLSCRIFCIRTGRTCMYSCLTSR